MINLIIFNLFIQEEVMTISKYHTDSGVSNIYKFSLIYPCVL